MTSPALAERLDGLLFFPVTAFGPDGGLDLDAFRAHVRAGVDAGAAAVFACCGTGEFHALSPEEFGACVAAAVEETAGRVPVVAGRRIRHRARPPVRGASPSEAGADGLLAMPPYLVVADQEGLLRHYTALAAGTGLDVIVYQRDNAVFTPETVVALARVPNIIGLKDGLGDLDLMQRIISAVRTELPGHDFLYFNGLPTAELTGLAYRGIGVTLYSSAVYAFSPEIALAFHRALTTGDDTTVDQAARRLLPAAGQPPQPGPRLRRLAGQGRRCGCAAWTSARCGRRCPSRRAAHVKELAELIERGLALLGDN